MAGAAGSGMWRLCLLLIWGGVTVSSLPVEETPMKCESSIENQNQNIMCTFDVRPNNNVTLVAHASRGDTDKGCMFRFTSSDNKFTCCYIQYPISKDSNLCNPEWQDEKCRKNTTYRVVEKRIGHIAEQCILHLFGFQFGDVGEYKAVFPSGKNKNRLFYVSNSGLTGVEIAGIIFGVILSLLLIMCALYRIFGPWTETVDWWKRRRWWQVGRHGR
jgi:hypothetical protein